MSRPSSYQESQLPEGSRYPMGPCGAPARACSKLTTSTDWLSLVAENDPVWVYHPDLPNTHHGAVAQEGETRAGPVQATRAELEGPLAEKGWLEVPTTEEGVAPLVGGEEPTVGGQTPPEARAVVPPRKKEGE